MNLPQKLVEELPVRLLCCDVSKNSRFLLKVVKKVFFHQCDLSCIRILTFISRDHHLQPCNAAFTLIHLKGGALEPSPR